MDYCNPTLKTPETVISAFTIHDLDNGQYLTGVPLHQQCNCPIDSFTLAPETISPSDLVKEWPEEPLVATSVDPTATTCVNLCGATTTVESLTDSCIVVTPFHHRIARRSVGRLKSRRATAFWT